MTNKLISAVSVLCAVVGISSCKSAPEVQPTSYETVTLQTCDIDVPLKFSAEVKGRNDVRIVPQTSGQLMQVCVIQGQKVKKGQVLFKIDDRRDRQTVNALTADVLAAEAQCNTAKLEYESNKNLYEKGIVSEYLLTTSYNDYNRAKAAVEQAKAALENAKLYLDFCTVTTPVDGVVGDIPNNPGDMVSQNSVLTVISGNSEMKAVFSIAEEKVYQLVGEVGSLDKAVKYMPEATFILKDGTVYPLPGKVASFSGVIDNVTGSLTCNVMFPNPDGVLFSGIQGTVQFLLKYENVIVAPLSALVRVQDKAYVYRVKDNCAESVIVNFEEVGNGKDVVLLDGVSVGDVLVASGASNVYEGQQVIFPKATQK